MTNLIVVIVETLWIPIDATFFFTQFTTILNVVVVKNSLRKGCKITRIIGGKFRFYLSIDAETKSFSWAVIGSEAVSLALAGV